MVPESVSLLNWALSDERHTVIVLRASLPDSMPVNGDFHTFHMIFNIDYHLVVFANLYTGSWQHTIGSQDTSFDTIGQHALAVTPHDIGSIRSTYLASPKKLHSN